MKLLNSPALPFAADDRETVFRVTYARAARTARAARNARVARTACAARTA